MGSERVSPLREYETVFVLHPSLEEKDVESEIQAVRDLITGSGGAVDEVERWGRRRLAYEIRKVHEGTYTLIRFKGQAQTLKDLERRFRLNEMLLRHLTVLSEGPPPPPKPEEPVGAPEPPEEDFELPRGGPRSSYIQSSPPAPDRTEGGKAAGQ